MNNKDIATAAAATAGFVGGSFVAGPIAGAAAATAAAAGTHQLMADRPRAEASSTEQSDGRN